MNAKERKILINFIKARYPIGSEIVDETRSQPFTVRKDSVFEVMEWDYREKPEDNRNVYVDFLIRCRGKYSENYFIMAYPKGWAFDYVKEKLNKT
jgi:hypothetical protein